MLRGQLPAGALDGKYVLVGAAASGLGDMFATPVSQQSRLMPGVEVVAHVLDARLAGERIVRAPQALNIAFNLWPVACALLALLIMGPLAALLLSMALPWGQVCSSRPQRRCWALRWPTRCGAGGA